MSQRKKRPFTAPSASLAPANSPVRAYLPLLVILILAVLDGGDGSSAKQVNPEFCCRRSSGVRMLTSSVGSIGSSKSRPPFPQPNMHLCAFLASLLMPPVLPANDFAIVAFFLVEVYEVPQHCLDAVPTILHPNF
jgi:hypothetical protein